MQNQTLSRQQYPAWVSYYPDCFQFHDSLLKIAAIGHDNDEVVVTSFTNRPRYESYKNYYKAWCDMGGQGKWVEIKATQGVLI